MEIKNNSLIDSIIDYANVKFGIEISSDQVKQQTSQLNFSLCFFLYKLNGLQCILF